MPIIRTSPATSNRTLGPVDHLAPLAPAVVGTAAVAAALAVSKPTVLAWARAGRLPAPFRMGARFVWRVEEIEPVVARIQREGTA